MCCAHHGAWDVGTYSANTTYTTNTTYTNIGDVVRCQEELDDDLQSPKMVDRNSLQVQVIQVPEPVYTRSTCL